MPGPRGGPMRRGQGNVEKPKDFKKTTKKLIDNYLSKYKIGNNSSNYICNRKYNIYYCRTQKYLEMLQQKYLME